MIPRPDTELLCETAADWLRNTLLPDSPSFATVLDLCAGSGCVALGTARLFPGARVTAMELSAQALPISAATARGIRILTLPRCGETC